MKTKKRYILTGILTFFIGCAIILVLDLLLSSESVNGPINCNVFNIGIYSIVFAILYFASLFVVFMSIIINILLNDRKN